MTFASFFCFFCTRAGYIAYSMLCFCDHSYILSDGSASGTLAHNNILYAIQSLQSLSSRQVVPQQTGARTIDCALNTSKFDYCLIR